MSLRKSKRIKKENEIHVAKVNDSDDDRVEADKEDIDNYDKIRRENIKRNLQFLDSIGIQNVKSDLQVQSAVNSTVKSTRGLSGAKRKNSSILPPRRSGRVTIERLKKEIDDALADGASDNLAAIDQKRKDLEDMMAKKEASTYDVSSSYVDSPSVTRHSSDPIPLSTPLNQPKHVNETADQDWGHELLPLLLSAGKCEKGARKKSSKTCNADYKENISRLQVVEADVAKVVPQRITALTIHPSVERTVVVAGDKQGHVGFWNADESDSIIGGKATLGGEDGVYLYKPHVGNVAALHISPHAPDQLWSVSYDGTIRRTDMEQQSFVQVYEAPGELDEISFHDAAFTSIPGAAYLGCRSGDVVMLDLKSGTAGWTAQAHEAKVNSVQIHPHNENILVSASTGMNGLIAVHDLRKVKSGSMWEPLFTLNRHSRSINAAYLSPDTGEYLVSVSLDNTVKIWKDIMTNTTKPVVKSISHDNHTGRWLSTLKPAFDPNVNSNSFASFVLGSMAKPRRVEVFSLQSNSSDTSEILGNPTINLMSENLGSVCSRNCFHPRKSNVIAGGNSSGKVHLFR